MENYIFNGVLTHDAEAKTNQNGSKFLLISIAVPKKAKNPTPEDGRGEYVNVPKYVSCTYYTENAEKLAPKLVTGTKVTISGVPEATAYISKTNELKSVMNCKVYQLDITSSKKPNQASTPVAPINNNDIPF